MNIIHVLHNIIHVLHFQKFVLSESRPIIDHKNDDTIKLTFAVISIRESAPHPNTESTGIGLSLFLDEFTLRSR